jgi:hypothetical protein
VCSCSDLQRHNFKFATSDDGLARRLALGTAELIERRRPAVLIADGTVNDQWNGLDVQARTFERRALAGEPPRKEKRIAVYPREDADLEMHNLYTTKTTRFRFVADLVDDTENDR